MAKRLLDDKEILDLSFLYSKFINNCKIISYHGTTDNLISSQYKAEFCNKIRNCSYNEISADKVDSIVFNSTNHGLDADFKELFKYTMENNSMNFEKGTCLDLDNEIIFSTSKHKYIINYQNVVPKLIVV
jgi:hypothetical protein